MPGQFHFTGLVFATPGSRNVRFPDEVKIRAHIFDWSTAMEIQQWPVSAFTAYKRQLRKNDRAVALMAATQARGGRGRTRTGTPVSQKQILSPLHPV